MRSDVGPEAGGQLEAAEGGVVAVMRGARAVTVKEAAERARVSVKTIRRAYMRGDLPYYQTPPDRHALYLLVASASASSFRTTQPHRPDRPRTARIRRSPAFYTESLARRV